MDILDKLIGFAQIKGSVDVQCLFREKWYVRHEPKRAHGLVHIVTAGEGYIKIDGEREARLLKEGDVVFFPRTAGHVLSSDTGCGNSHDKISDAANGAFTLKQSGGSGVPDMGLFCARFEYDSRADLMNNLPEAVFLNMQHPSLQCLVTMLHHESEKALHGATAVVDALSAVLLVLLVRAYLDSGRRVPLYGLLNGWRDRRLGILVQTVVDNPEHDWDVARMSAVANISRAQLMRLFKQQIGISPHAFVNHVRLQQAAVLLKQTADSVLSIALTVGFQSEAHFGKAFKKRYGIPPGQYRKTQERTEPPAQTDGI